MKKAILCVIGTLILVLSIFYAVIKPGEQAVSVAESNFVKPTFAITGHGEEYLEIGKKGTRIGEQISPLKLTDVRGKEVVLGSKKALLVFASSGLKSFYPLLQDWSKTYAPLLDVILVFREQPEAELMDQLVASGVYAVVDSEKVVSRIDSGYVNYCFLIDEQGEVVYRFRLLTHLWRELSRDVDLFARKSIIPSTEEQHSLALGEPLAWCIQFDQICSWLRLSHFQNKPTILILLNPGDPINDQILLLLSSLYTAYNQTINITLVYSTFGTLNENIVKEYFDRYGLLNEFQKWKQTWDGEMKTDTEKPELFPVHYDQNRYIFDQPEIWMTPTILILDKDVCLIDIFGIGQGGGFGLQELEKMIQKQLTKLL